MKRNMMLCAMSVAMMAVSLTACNNASPKMDEQPSNESAATSNGGTKIAYVEVDSLMSQYKFCKDYSLILQKKSNNARNTLSQKGAQLQAAAANFQQKLNNNGFASREQAAAVQNAIQRQQQDLQELQQRLESELASETNKYNAALRDSLQHFLKVYNKDKKYDLILSKAGDNILYASKKNDITQDVVNGLNKNYKPTGKLAQETAKK
jgi:outer membrane protein